MEFERSLFRVHEKILSTLVSGHDSGRQCRSVMRVVMFICLTVAILCLVLLVTLHKTFVGDGSCLQATIQLEGLEPKVYDVVSELEALRARQNSTTTEALTHPASDQDLKKSFMLSDSVIRVWAFRPSPHDRALSTFELAETHDEEGRARPDYEFSLDPAFLLVDESLRAMHSIQEWNFTLPPTCLGRWNAVPLLRSIVDMTIDDIVVNQFIHGLTDSEGVLRSQATHESWSWRQDDHAKRSKFGLISKLLMNLVALWRAFMLLLLVSSITAFMVRTLVSSGVAILFPLFSLVRFVRGQDELQPQVFRLLTLSYPWIGGEVDALQQSGQSTSPLIRAHLLNVLLTYAAYEACQFAWRRWLLGFKPQPAGIEVWGVFAYIMVCEYFLLIFARSAMTLRYLPRIMAMHFVLFTHYALSVPYGFTSIAAICMWAMTVFWMLWFILECEVKAIRRGIISLEVPRAFFTHLASPQWPISLPPHWSTFHEMNRAHPRSIYDTNPVPGEGDANTPRTRGDRTVQGRNSSALNETSRLPGMDGPVLRNRRTDSAVPTEENQV